MKRRILAITLCMLLACTAVLAAACTGGINTPITPPPATEAPTEAPVEATKEPIAQQTGLTFENGLDVRVDSFYVSPVTSEDWGEAVLEAILSGESVRFDFADFGGEAGYVYDIGAVDENGYNYDIWDVELLEGDVLRLTGDTNEEVGSLAVTHADGTVEEYEAEVYPAGESPYEKTAIVLNPCTDRHSDYCYDEELGKALAYYSIETVVLDPGEAQYLPGLSAAVDDMNAAELAAAEAIYEDLIETGRADCEQDADNFVSSELTVRAFFRRADTRVFSVLFEREINYGGYSHWQYSSYNIDSMTGDELTLAGVVDDPSRLPALINEQMEGRNEDGFMLDEDADYSEYFSEWNCPDLAWTLDPHGISIVFNDGAFGIEEASLSTIMIPFSEHPELVGEELTACPENYSVAFPWGLENYFEIEGRVMPLIVAGFGADDGWMYQQMGVYLNEGEYIEEHLEAFDFTPLYIHINGCDYLYVEVICMNDYRVLYAYDLFNGAVSKCGDIQSGWYQYYEDAEDDDDYHFYTRVMPDPEYFLLTTRTDVLSTVDGSKLYTIGEDGLPESTDEWYSLDTQLVFTLLRDLEVTNADGTRETLRAGENVTYVATDNDRVAVICQADMPEWYLTIEYIDNVGPAIDGVSIFDIFDGLRFAG